jgi:hypothetical protein
MAKKAATTRQKQSDALFIYVSGQQHGPYPLASIAEWHKSGNIQPNDMIFSRGQWVPIASFFTGDEAGNDSPHSDLDGRKKA